VKIGLAQINTTIGSFEDNLKQILRFTNKAHTANADIVVFPELSLCGYPPRDLVEQKCFVQQNLSYIDRLSQEIPRNISVIVGAVTQKRSDPKPFNSAIMLRNGRVELIQSKMLLPTYDVFDESRNFERAKEQTVFTLKNKQVGLCICEDMWNNHKFNEQHHRSDPYERDPVTELIRGGAEILISINASPYHVNKLHTISELLRDVALEHEVPVVWVNSVGGNDHLVFYGGSRVVSSRGQVVCNASLFEEDLVYYDTATDKGDIQWEIPEGVDQVAKALVVGTRDYVRKCGFKKVVIGLSGGIDSAVTAAIAVQALGKDAVIGIRMPSQLSSQHSLDDALVLANNLGIKLETIPIQPMVDTFRATALSSSDWKLQGLAYENLQARVRGTLLMSYSNSSGAMVLTTGNKSELAVGYCTLYGDMCGGLAVISDVPKSMVYELARYINYVGGPSIPQSTITKPPSAELAPGQKDTDSLPPYDILDTILHAYIEEVRCPDEIARTEGIESEVVSKVVRMIERNEYKRQQAATGIRITSKAFGMGRRYPIARVYEHTSLKMEAKTA
jgi:NAD+ synthase (glutamine-hydrolysing)